MYANILMPILGNRATSALRAVALTGGIFPALGVPNLSPSRAWALLHRRRGAIPQHDQQFCGQIGQISQQINAVVMGSCRRRAHL